MPETLHRAPIAIVDEDRSQLSARIADAFFPVITSYSIHYTKLYESIVTKDPASLLA